MSTSHDAYPEVVIVGAGFGGLHAARALSGAPVRMTVIDRHNHHLFQPLLYQVATASLSPSDIAYPIRAIFRREPNVRILQAEVVGIRLSDRTIVLKETELTYDILILAPGARHSYFGHPEWEREAPGLKSAADALVIRDRILSAFEQAERQPDPLRRRALLTFVVVGGGPTGVELAGAIAEIAFKVMVREFRMINPHEARVILVQGGARVLPTYPESLSWKAQRDLQRLGVEVRTGSRVTGISSGLVQIGAETIRAETVLWAAGVKPSPLAASFGVPLDKTGRVIVRPDLTVPGHPEVFVIGDMAACIPPGHQAPLPGLAPVAMQQGQYAARTIRRRLQGRPDKAFRYEDRGTMATIGRGLAVADLRGVKLSGFIAWLVWLVVHIFFLIGFRNRVLVLLKWMWSFLMFQPSTRVIIGVTPSRPERE